MTPWRRFLNWFTGDLTARPEPVQIGTRAEPNWRKLADELEMGSPERARVFAKQFPIPVPPPVADPKRKLAMDNAYNACVAQTNSVYSWANTNMFGDTIGFPGFTYLAELQQRPEHRRANEIIAQEMTRKWLRLTYAGESSGDKLAHLDAAMRRFGLQMIVRRVIELDGALGRGHLYADTGAKGDELGKPLLLDAGLKVGKGDLRAFRAIEPTWVYPDAYGSTDPLAADYYRPQVWLVQGQRVHITRMPVYVAREVNDIIKPAYSFGGLSLTQMGKPYVDNWLRTRQSVSDTIHSFSVFKLGTNMADTLTSAGIRNIIARVKAFTLMRDNNGLMVTDEEKESLENVAAPLTNLDKLQDQSQEQMCSVFGIPRLKFLGLAPAGLGTNSDGEMRSFYDWIHSNQEKLNPIIKWAIDLIQLNEFGVIDDGVGFEWIPLWQMSDTEKATNAKTEAEADQIYVAMGAISNEEVRAKLANDDESPFAGLDVDDMPEPPEQDEAEPDPVD